MIVDADAGQNRRKIVSFVGGLDVCNGRFDTPKHPLFRTLKTFHKDDFHNPNFLVTIQEKKTCLVAMLRFRFIVKNFVFLVLDYCG